MLFVYVSVVTFLFISKLEFMLNRSGPVLGKVKYGGEQQKFGDREALGWRILTSIQSWQWLEVEKNHVYPVCWVLFLSNQVEETPNQPMKDNEETWSQGKLTYPDLKL